MRYLLTLLLCLSLATPGWAGASRDFDGTNDNVDFGGMSSLDNQANVSIGCWVYADNVTQDHYIVDFFDAVATTTGGILFLHDDVDSVSGRTDVFTIYVEETGGGGSNVRIATATSSAKSQTWQWVVLTFDNESTTGFKIYIDNVEDANSPASTVSIANAGNHNETFYLGERSDGAAGDRAGNIAHCQTWNRTLGVIELIEAGFNPGVIPLNLTSWWPMFGAESPEIDLTGAGNTGTVSGATEAFIGPPVMSGGGLPL